MTRHQWYTAALVTKRLKDNEIHVLSFLSQINYLKKTQKEIYLVGNGSKLQQTILKHMWNETQNV